MNKNETIELLEKQLPGFYSVEQVIELIKGIEDGTNDLNIDALVEVIRVHIIDVVRNMDADNACDFSSAKFSLSGNEIQLEMVDLESRNIASESVHGLEHLIEEFLRENK